MSFSPDTSGLLDALRRRDFDAAEHAMAALERAPENLTSLGEGLMRRRRWADAAWLFDQIESRDAATEMKRVLSRNLAAMQTHRRHIYETLIALPATDSLGISAAAGGRPTILARLPDGSATSFSAGSDPLASAAATLAQVRRTTPNGESVALCGLGDGYLLQLLAQNPPELFMDMQQAVFVIEPQPQVLLHVLMIHDLAADSAGAIAAERFRWFVGEDWHAQLHLAITEEPTIGVPNVTIKQGLDGNAVHAGVQATIQSLIAADNRTAREVETYYATLAPSAVAGALGARPPRQPRVLLLTTRFSTVLQHSTYDTARAFTDLGWDARVLIEPSPSHRLYKHTMRAELAAFRPDLVFQIDHLRHEHGDLFAANVPFVCWVQDHLPQLKTPTAAASVTENDFVLTDAGPVYAATFGYPERQLIGLNKLTRVPSAPMVIEPRGDDLVFVSNASYVCGDLLASRVADYDGTPEGRALLAAAGPSVIETYAAGGCVATWIELLALVRRLQERLAIDVAPDEVQTLAAWLFHPLNDALYRQQAVDWAAQAANDMGLTLALYGKGWERHPRFAQFARGPVAYGPELEALTRRSRFNLQIVPYLCLHQRLLDGLAAGGFYLTRRHPADTEVGVLLKYLDAGAAPQPGDLDHLIAACRPALATSDADDAVAIARYWQETRLIDSDYSVLPKFDQTSFSNAVELRQCVARFITSERARQDVGERQRESVVERFSYTSGIQRVLDRVGRLLAENAAALELRRAAA
jgi:hypothetical protein